jgi:hypothetical protein
MKGIKVSRQRLQLLRLLKKNVSLSSKINIKYQITYKKVTSEAQKGKMTELFQGQ